MARGRTRVAQTTLVRLLLPPGSRARLVGDSSRGLAVWIDRIHASRISTLRVSLQLGALPAPRCSSGSGVSVGDLVLSPDWMGEASSASAAVSPAMRNRLGWLVVGRLSSS